MNKNYIVHPVVTINYMHPVTPLCLQRCVFDMHILNWTQFVYRGGVLQQWYWNKAVGPFHRAKFMASFDHAEFYINCNAMKPCNSACNRGSSRLLAGIGSRLVLTRIASVSQLVVAAVWTSVCIMNTLLLSWQQVYFVLRSRLHTAIGNWKTKVIDVYIL